MKFVIFAILLTGACVSALPQNEPTPLPSTTPITNVDVLATLKKNLLKPLEVLEDSLQTYLDEIGKLF